MILFLTIVSGVAWTVVYIDAIRIGFRDRSYAIPAAALGLNFAWEAIYATRSIATGITVAGGLQHRVGACRRRDCVHVPQVRPLRAAGAG